MPAELAVSHPRTRSGHALSAQKRLVQIMKMKDADVIWTPMFAASVIKEYPELAAPDAGHVRIERRHSGWQRTPGDRWMPVISLGEMGEVSTKDDPTKQLLAMFILFNTLVIRDGIHPFRAHEAFLEIDEYRQTISPDSPGADV
jgi:hypothetical protein